MKQLPINAQMEIDRNHLWHPYSAMHSELPVYHVESAAGVRLKLSNGAELIDGMSSWWCAIHGYNHPELNRALIDQVDVMSHVMFGGLTHAPAIHLGEKLVAMSPAALSSVFICDSGSVAVEVAMKMAIQYWQALGKPEKQRFATLKHGYHGDTLGAMSVCDPVTGMHSLFNQLLPEQLFIERPRARYGEACDADDLAALEQLLEQHQHELAALILEPIVQGAGGMYFYSADYLAAARRLCERYGLLFIADEIATGFGRSGKLFACEHAAVTPDIMCVGKALTGGYMSLAATLTTAEVSDTIDRGDPGVFMHGPTFMANPLACAVALASLELLQNSDWQTRVQDIEQQLSKLLQPCGNLPQVSDVRCLGAIAVVEMTTAVDMARITEQFVDAGVWVRPFGKLVYLMPAYSISGADLATLAAAVVEVVTQQDA